MPTATVIGFWPNAVVVWVDAPLGIFTVVLPAGPDVDPVDGDEGELYPPQAVKHIASMRTDVRRINIFLILLRVPRGKRTAGLSTDIPGNVREHPVGYFRNERPLSLRVIRQRVSASSSASSGESSAPDRASKSVRGAANV